jgi:hypothetical protein
VHHAGASQSTGSLNSSSPCDAARSRYIAVLDTYSGHRALDDERRERLYERIHQRAEARPAGKVRKTYLASLNVAARL